MKIEDLTKKGLSTDVKYITDSKILIKNSKNEVYLDVSAIYLNKSISNNNDFDFYVKNKCNLITFYSDGNVTIEYNPIPNPTDLFKEDYIDDFVLENSEAYIKIESFLSGENIFRLL